MENLEIISESEIQRIEEKLSTRGLSLLAICIFSGLAAIAIYYCLDNPPMLLIIEILIFIIFIYCIKKNDSKTKDSEYIYYIKEDLVKVNTYNESEFPFIKNLEIIIKNKTYYIPYSNIKNSFDNLNNCKNSYVKFKIYQARSKTYLFVNELYITEKLKKVMEEAIQIEEKRILEQRRNYKSIN